MMGILIGAYGSRADVDFRTGRRSRALNTDLFDACDHVSPHTIEITIDKQSLIRIHYNMCFLGQQTTSYSKIRNRLCDSKLALK